MADTNIVTMSLQSYNSIKAENTKYNLFIGRLFEECELKPDYSGIQIDSDKIEDLLHLVYPDMYKKKLSTLRTQQTKMSIKKLNINEPKEETEES